MACHLYLFSAFEGMLWRIIIYCIHCHYISNITFSSWQCFLYEQYGSFRFESSMFRTSFQIQTGQHHLVDTTWWAKSLPWQLLKYTKNGKAQIGIFLNLLVKICKVHICSHKQHLVGGWTNPIEKKMLVKLGIFSPNRGENKKYLSCHQLVAPPPIFWGVQSSDCLKLFLGGVCMNSDVSKSKGFPWTSGLFRRSHWFGKTKHMKYLGIPLKTHEICGNTTKKHMKYVGMPLNTIQ